VGGDNQLDICFAITQGMLLWKLILGENWQKQAYSTFSHNTGIPKWIGEGLQR